MAGKKRFEDLDEPGDDVALRFGKYKGQTPNQIARHDPRYVVWLYDNVTPAVCARELARDCEVEAQDMESEAYLDEAMYDLGDEFWKE